MQKLILPINSCKLNASWKTQAYTNQFGFSHYGCDLICSDIIKNRKIWGSGRGVVVDQGFDVNCGNVLIIKYSDAFNHATGKTADVLFRYFHLQKISVVKGQEISTKTVLGEYGGTGKYGGGMFSKHLHVEADYDVTHPRYTPTVTDSTWLVGSNQSNASLQAMLKTMTNPISLLHTKTSAPDKQKYTTANDAYILNEDRQIPIII